MKKAQCLTMHYAYVARIPQNDLESRAHKYRKFGETAKIDATGPSFSKRK